MTITREDVTWAFRLLLDREPEDSHVVEQFAAALSSRRELRMALLQSEEFRTRNPLDAAYSSDSCVVIAEMEPGLRLFVDLSDVAIGLNVARKGYEPREVAFVKRTLQPGAVVLDVGANIGFYTVLAASLVGPGGHVYAYEPVPANADLLERSLRENSFESRVTLARAVVGDRAGLQRLIHLPLHKNARNSGGSYLAPQDAPPPRGHDVLQVPMLRLDELDLRRPVRFIKIDVEGAEPLVFRGARSLLARDRPLILAEINPTQLSKVALCSVRQFLDEMTALGYRCFGLGDNTWQPFKEDEDDGSVRSAVFAPAETPLPLA
jgi:FkbM family methyltransferase